MRVLHVSQPTEAGVPNVLLSLVEDQVSRGWEVHVACPAATGYLAERARGLGATHHTWEAQRAPGPSVLRETLALQRVLSRVRPDVVHLHASKAGLAGRLALRGRTPTIVMPHSWSFEAVGGPVGALSLLWERLGSRWADVTLCVSDAERAVGDRKGCLARRSVVVPNGVDLVRWSPGDRQSARSRLGVPQDVPVVVTVGRLARQKGQDLLLAAWPRILEEVPAAQLYLVGDGPDRAALEATLPEHVTLVGAQDPHDWFVAADVVVMPSRWEGMALVLLEAMASGACVVSTDVAGAREALGEGDALVPVDSSPLVAPVVRRLTHPDLAQREGRANRARVEAGFDARRSQEMAAQVVEGLVH